MTNANTTKTKCNKANDKGQTCQRYDGHDGYCQETLSYGIVSWSN